MADVNRHEQHFPCSTTNESGERTRLAPKAELALDGVVTLEVDVENTMAQLASE
jgi:hypothetical protein